MKEETMEDILLEKKLHEQLRRALQKVADKHEIFIDSIDVEWFDISDAAQKRMVVREIKMRSTS